MLFVYVIYDYQLCIAPNIKGIDEKDDDDDSVKGKWSYNIVAFVGGK